MLLKRGNFFNIYLQEKQLLEPKGEKGVENLLPNIYMLGILLFNKRAASSWYSIFIDKYFFRILFIQCKSLYIVLQILLLLITYVYSYEFFGVEPYLLMIYRLWQAVYCFVFAKVQLSTSPLLNLFEVHSHNDGSNIVQTLDFSNGPIGQATAWHVTGLGFKAHCRHTVPPIISKVDQIIC